ncbi:DUF4917 family protein [Pectobacterium brasiliense]|uniref:DUF4917 family protein n=1 Tax=Pectobacterium TaxID=122277 RepID=UPI001969154A|nr:DUF4917 family protein [Pectobacterium brasiliense]MBN3175518.1 DUF4917 family protein [Pectobacterium brasiliense]
MPLATFEEKMIEINGESPSILLGNGFSQAWRRDIFSYFNLLQEANFGVRQSTLMSLFDQLSTYDFEKVMQALDLAERVCRNYNVDPNAISMINDDKQQLRTSLIDVITRRHPARSSYVTLHQYGTAKPFTYQFRNIFTLNYDLLLYWIINKTEVIPYGYHHSDGFMGDTWIDRPEQSIFFLHGGLHIYDTGTSIRKHVFNDHRNTSIAEQVGANLNAGHFPLFVSEPNWENKLQKIRHNPYLNSCYNSLKKINGSLFIHGHSMAENDRHIFDQIQKSNVSRVFVGIFGDINLPSNRESVANAHRFIENQRISVDFYDAATAAIWS